MVCAVGAIKMFDGAGGPLAMVPPIVVLLLPKEFRSWVPTDTFIWLADFANHLNGKETISKRPTGIKTPLSLRKWFEKRDEDFGSSIFDFAQSHDRKIED